MPIFRRKRVIYCGAIHPFCGYKRKRFRTVFRFPPRKEGQASLGEILALIVVWGLPILAMVRWVLGK